MIKELLTNVSATVLGLPYFTSTGVRKAKPITLPVISCPSLRKGPVRQEAIVTILVTMKNANMAQLYDEIEGVISAVALPGNIDWRTASVATGTDGHYAEVVFEATVKLSQPTILAPTAILESAVALYDDP